MRLKLIACKVLYREVSLLTCNSPHIVDVTYLRQGYHNTPDLLRKILQKNIDAIDSGDDVYSYRAEISALSGRSTGSEALGLDTGGFDAILLGYGLCSNAIVGLKSKRHRLVVPRAHDCITLFLGSKEQYRGYFDAQRGGIYWYTGGWLDNTLMPGRERDTHTREVYAAKYGEENADFLLEAEQGWMREYKRCTFVDWPELDNVNYLDYTGLCAKYLNWELDVVPGQSGLLRRFLSGEWNDEDFLVLEPGEEIAPSFDNGIIKRG